MMRSLWTAASGMTSQQFFVDNISHNLSNVNTTGFKRGRVEFNSLLYQTMQRADLDPANMTGRPTNLQVGLGARPVAVSRMFTQGNLQRTDNNLDFAIDGNGFFTVLRNAEPEEELAFTRDGSFNLSPVDGGLMLSTNAGHPVLSADGEPIIIPDDIDWQNVLMDDTGNFFSVVDGEMEELGFQLQITQFPNPQGLEAVGGNLFLATVAAGEALNEGEDDVNVISRIIQGVLEMSNVNVAEEMVDMIRAHRAYDLNARAITTSDEMLQTANGLKR